MISYDDEWFAEEIRVELCDTITIAVVSRSMFKLADCVGVSVIDANAM